jgi:hypothetical protein
MALNLSTQLVNQLLSYLGTKPYQEVYQLIHTIQDEVKLQQLTEQKDS